MLIGIWISPAALGAIALAILLGLRAPWWAVLAVVAACAALASRCRRRADAVE